MASYQVLARKYRPQRFQDVVGQDSLVATLKNAVRFKRVAHAYLFCGSRGTGKTTLARLFSKALNCSALSESGEPCNACPSCKAVTQGNSLDMLEIDGASNRGIDDIRQITEAAGYAPSNACGYKVYLIDEVHMLTKEAFNALLKTLEEPPPNVVFFFATTEPHKVPATIVSRCQRFHLQRISPSKICDKLRSIAKDLDVLVEEEALRLLADASEGSLRDAESLFDQAIAFQDKNVSTDGVTDMLGWVPRKAFFALDRAIAAGDLAFAFELADDVLSKGKDILHFLESMIDHYRRLLVVRLQKPSLISPESEALATAYVDSASLFTHEQLLSIIDTVMEAQQQWRSPRQTALEALLLRVIRSYRKLPVEMLVQRLEELEQRLSQAPSASSANAPAASPVIPEPAKPARLVAAAPAADPLPAKPKTAAKEPAAPLAHPSHYETLMRFAAVELEGVVKKTNKS